MFSAKTSALLLGIVLGCNEIPFNWYLCDNGNIESNVAICVSK